MRQFLNTITAILLLLIEHFFSAFPVAVPLAQRLPCLGAESKEESPCQEQAPLLAGRTFSSIRPVHRLLRKGNYSERVGAGAPVYLAAVPIPDRRDSGTGEPPARDNKKPALLTSQLQPSPPTAKITATAGSCNHHQREISPNISGWCCCPRRLRAITRPRAN